MADFKLDTREFRAALKSVLSITRKEGAKYLNKKALEVIIGGKGVEGAIKLTPRAKKDDIDAVPLRDIAAKVAIRLRREGKVISGEDFKNLVKKEVKRRKSSISYTAGPGWHNAAKALGGRGVKRQKGFEKSKAAEGSGKKATPVKALAIITNTAPASEKKGAEALQKAIDNVAKDMKRYGAKKIPEKSIKATKPK